MLEFVMAALLLTSYAGYGHAKVIRVSWIAPLKVKTIHAVCGDHLVFHFKSGNSSVNLVEPASMDGCPPAVCGSHVVKRFGSSSPLTVTLKDAGTTRYISNVRTQCTVGKMILTVITTCPKAVPPAPLKASPPRPLSPPARASSPPPSALTPPPKALSSPPPSSASNVHVVTNEGGEALWTTGQAYPLIRAKCGDTLKFQWNSIVFHGPYQNHDVVQIPDMDAYNSCDFSAGTLLEYSTVGDSNIVTVPLTHAGSYYFMCSVAIHCRGGLQKVMASVTC